MLDKEELEKDRIASLKVLENSYIMYENSKKDFKKNAPLKKDVTGNPMYDEATLKKNLELINTSQEDIIEKYKQLGGNVEDLKRLSTKKSTDTRKQIEQIIKRDSDNEALFEYLSKQNKNTKVENTEDTQKLTEEENVNTFLLSQEQPTLQDSEVDKYITNRNEQESKKTFIPETSVLEQQQQIYSQQKMPFEMGNKPNNNQMRQMYDVIQLPSGGKCYKNKKGTIKVSYLTAFDENMILSPNLYKNGNFLDYLLKAKVIDSDFNVDDLVQGDRDAIVIWLRGTGYGNNYPIIVTDDETGKEFETSVDLSKLEFKPFKLNPDENGCFEYTLPTSKDIIKFKFLSHKDIMFLNTLKTKESKKMTIKALQYECSQLESYLDVEDLISYNAQTKIKECIKTVNDEISKNYDESTDISFSHELTDRLLLQTVSINGISDRKYINDYIINMNVKDASSYRKYIIENEPGVDFTVEVERPESLGGGSMKSFLRFDQFVFINI